MRPRAAMAVLNRRVPAINSFAPPPLKTIAPGVSFGERHFPEFVGRWIGGDFTFLARLHVYTVDALAVGGIGVTNGQLARVILRLPDAFGQFFFQRLGFANAEFGVSNFQDVIGGEWFAAFAVALDATGRNRILAPDAAALDDAPARRLQRGINMFGACLGFVHLLILHQIGRA